MDLKAFFLGLVVEGGIFEMKYAEMRVSVRTGGFHYTCLRSSPVSVFMAEPYYYCHF